MLQSLIYCIQRAIYFIDIIYLFKIVGISNTKIIIIFQWKSSPVPSQPSGFYWVKHKCSATAGYVCKRRLSQQHILKNQTVQGSSGELSSPNYPDVYENDLDYWVHIVGDDDTRLVFVFESIDLEIQKDCLYDFVEVSFDKYILINDKRSRGD